MLTTIHPKLPMRDKTRTLNFYQNQLGFTPIGSLNFPDYLMLQKDKIEIHFFLYEALNTEENYAQVYIRTENIQDLYLDILHHQVAIHPNGHLATKPWGQIEFSLLDPDNNLLTFGQSVVP